MASMRMITAIAILIMGIGTGLLVGVQLGVYLERQREPVVGHSGDDNLGCGILFDHLQNEVTYI